MRINYAHVLVLIGISFIEISCTLYIPPGVGILNKNIGGGFGNAIALSRYVYLSRGRGVKSR